jgi:hypothetical protein
MRCANFWYEITQEPETWGCFDAHHRPVELHGMHGNARASLFSHPRIPVQGCHLWRTGVSEHDPDLVKFDLS